MKNLCFFYIDYLLAKKIWARYYKSQKWVQDLSINSSSPPFIRFSRCYSRNSEETFIKQLSSSTAIYNKWETVYQIITLDIDVPGHKFTSYSKSLSRDIIFAVYLWLVKWGNSLHYDPSIEQKVFLWEAANQTVRLWKNVYWEGYE